MRRIKRVDALDSRILDIEFDNGYVLLMDLNTMRKKPEVSALLDSGNWCFPKTDGTSIYWRDGPRLNADELMKELTKESSEEPYQKEGGEKL